MLDIKVCYLFLDFSWCLVILSTIPPLKLLSHLACTFLLMYHVITMSIKVLGHTPLFFWKENFKSATTQEDTKLWTLRYTVSCVYSLIRYRHILSNCPSQWLSLSLDRGVVHSCCKKAYNKSPLRSLDINAMANQLLKLISAYERVWLKIKIKKLDKTYDAKLNFNWNPT